MLQRVIELAGAVNDHIEAEASYQLRFLISSPWSSGIESM